MTTHLHFSCETFLFHQMKQLHDQRGHEFNIRLKEQAVNCEFHDVDLTIKQQIVLATNNNKLQCYSFQNLRKTLQTL